MENIYVKFQAVAHASTFFIGPKSEDTLCIETEMKKNEETFVHPIARAISLQLAFPYIKRVFLPTSSFSSTLGEVITVHTDLDNNLLHVQCEFDGVRKYAELPLNGVWYYLMNLYSNRDRDYHTLDKDLPDAGSYREFAIGDGPTGGVRYQADALRKPIEGVLEEYDFQGWLEYNQQGVWIYLNRLSVKHSQTLKVDEGDMAAVRVNSELYNEIKNRVDDIQLIADFSIQQTSNGTDVLKLISERHQLTLTDKDAVLFDKTFTNIVHDYMGLHYPISLYSTF